MMNRRWQQWLSFRDQTCPLLYISPKEKKSNKYSFEASNEFCAGIRIALEAQCMVAREVEDVCFALSTAEFHVKCK